MRGSITAGVQAVQDITYTQSNYLELPYRTYNSLLYWAFGPDSDPASHYSATHRNSVGGIHGIHLSETAGAVISYEHPARHFV